MVVKAHQIHLFFMDKNAWNVLRKLDFFSNTRLLSWKSTPRKSNYLLCIFDIEVQLFFVVKGSDFH